MRSSQHRWGGSACSRAQELRHDTSGRRIFGIACGVHFEMNAVYPGAAPKEEHTPASITIANA
jgi:hypothetical protein